MPTLDPVDALSNMVVGISWKEAKSFRKSYSCKSYSIKCQKDTWCVVVNKQVIARIKISEYTIKGTKLAQICHACVHRNHRGQGWGSKLYKRILQHYGTIACYDTLCGKLGESGGSYGMWMKLLNTYPGGLMHDPYFVEYDERSPEITNYTEFKAFKSKKASSRVIFVCKNQESYDRFVA